MKTLLHFFLLLLLLMVIVMGGQVTGEAGGCHRAECEECEVLVEQEKTDLLKVDWSQAWWDLDLACLHSLTVTLNGESDWDYTALDTALLIYSLSLSTVQSLDGFYFTIFNISPRTGLLPP